MGNWDERNEVSEGEERVSSKRKESSAGSKMLSKETCEVEGVGSIFLGHAVG